MAYNNPDELLVRYGTLDDMTTRLGNEAKKLEECIDALKRAVGKVAEGWEGDSQRAFDGDQKKLDNHARSIHNSLMQIGQIVGHAGGDYMAGDKKAASYFNG
ncbi:WXG100 family type VII secretion target [Streptomyces sp. NPDC050418]|uniref:WXG100 family type VII secretion target n=1 Tax=Streptomyces sp. NPDC050418 TaxID=3365612 RepID=UPI003797752D